MNVVDDAVGEKRFGSQGRRRVCSGCHGWLVTNLSGFRAMIAEQYHDQ